MGKRNTTSSSSSRELIEYRHSYHCFLARNLPQYLPQPSNVPPPPPPPITLRNGNGIDLATLNLNPSEWKKHDLYLLLGLESKRHLATATEIKQAYHARLLQYHPDKLQQQKAPQTCASPQLGDDDEEDDSIFKCIFQAYQVLSNPERRQQYDSIDQQGFDESIPAEDAVHAGDIVGFLRTYRPAFIQNARFSRHHPVPDLGHPGSLREDVEAFYNFWFAFESWRTFDYLDEEDATQGENRADKRWLEKKNRASRLKHKNADNARLRKLVEQAYKLDPRMIRFREDDRLRKEAKRMEREMATLEITRQKEREAEERQKKEAEERSRIAKQIADAKRASQAAKATAEREKKALREFFVENFYFILNRSNIALLEERSILLEKYLLLQGSDYGIIQTHLQGLIGEGRQEEIFPWINAQYEQLQNRQQQQIRPTGPVMGENEQEKNKKKTLSSSAPWGLIETDLLIKAIKTHPGGLRDRWMRITEWYNRHVRNSSEKLPERSMEELIQYSNEIRPPGEGAPQASTILPLETQQHRLQKRDPRIDQAEPTIIYEKDKENTNQPPGSWAAEEQKRLEKALKTIPTDDPSRWERIAEMVGGGRNKKDCMLRAKEIAQLVKQKKVAAAKAGNM